jgi:hypothetical protein
MSGTRKGSGDYDTSNTRDLARLKKTVPEGKKCQPWEKG